MKLFAGLLMSVCLVAGGEESLDGEVWYDAEGKVAYVEGPAAKPAPRRFIPEWERRERERAERPRTRRSVSRSHHGWYGYRGWSVVRPCVPRVVRPWCVRPHHGGSVIIIR